MKTIIPVPVRIKMMRVEDIDFRLVAYKLLNHEEVCLPFEDGTYLSIKYVHWEALKTFGRNPLAFELKQYKIKKNTAHKIIKKTTVAADISELNLVIQRVISNKRVLINNDILFNEYLETEGKKAISFKSFKGKSILSPTEAQKIIRYVNNHLDENNNYIGAEVVPKEIQVDGNLDLSDIWWDIKVLPKKLVVLGDFKLDAAPVEIFPEFLEVKGNCLLENDSEGYSHHKYVKTKKYPVTLIVEKNLNWVEGKTLTELPTKLKVGENISLRCANIKKISNNFTVGGFVDLAGSNIKTLPDGFTINGGLSLYKSQITKLPDDLTIKGDLNISNCYKLKELPKNLTIEGNLLCKNVKIKTLPDDISIGGDIYAPFSEIEILPENLNVKGNLILSDSAIKELPKGLIVEKDFRADGTAIKSLPNDLAVNGSLDLRSTHIKELPKNLISVKDLYLEDTLITELNDNMVIDGALTINKTLIKSLPKNLVINGYFNMSKTKIEEIPEDLILNGELYAYESSLKKIPKNFVVYRTLDLRCSKMRSLPKDLQVVDGKNIDLSNTNIARIPEKLLNNVFDCYLNLSNTKINDLPANLVVESLNLQNTAVTKLPTNLKVKDFVAISGSNIKNIPNDLKADKVFYGPKQLELDKISKSLKENISFKEKEV